MPISAGPRPSCARIAAIPLTCRSASPSGVAAATQRPAWRGGVSWTLDRATAVHFAVGQHLNWNQSSRPILLRREATRREALAYFPGEEQEVVLAPGPYTLDTDDAAEMTRLAGLAPGIDIVPQEPEPGWPADWLRVEPAVTALATPASRLSRLHGPQHWRAVARVGVQLARLTPGADLGIVALFALCHDTQRLNDGHDPDHGRRAATMVGSLGHELGLTGGRLERLAHACAGHADGLTSDNPTVGACWDADRLNLWRVGMTPDPGLLSTEAARNEAIYGWSRQVHGQDPSWVEVRAAA
jgi:uncharacterized protein